MLNCIVNLFVLLWSMKYFLGLEVKAFSFSLLLVGAHLGAEALAKVFFNGFFLFCR